jgi:endonuclease IV
VYIAAHLSSAGGIHTAVDRAEAVGAESLQVFTQSPRAWRPTNHDPATFDRFRERRAEVGLHGVLCHALYLCNLAAPNAEVYEKSVAALRNTMQVRARSALMPSSSMSARTWARASSTGSSVCSPRWSRCSSLRPTRPGC